MKKYLSIDEIKKIFSNPLNYKKGKEIWSEAEKKGIKGNALLKRLRNQLNRNYRICDMTEWSEVNAHLIITDPPFGLAFDGRKGCYNRKGKFVVEGYEEWGIGEYEKNIAELLSCIWRNLNEEGQALIFSGWNHSHLIHKQIKSSHLILRGKLYWSYNFAVYCRNKPAHNVYEIFWVTKGRKWFYNNKCGTAHCLGEANLTTLSFPRKYIKGRVKYPTHLPLKLLKCLLQHFSKVGDLVFDPLAGSGMLGIVCYMLQRDFRLGDLNPDGKRAFQELLRLYSGRLFNQDITCFFPQKVDGEKSS